MRSPKLLVHGGAAALVVMLSVAMVAAQERPRLRRADGEPQRVTANRPVAGEAMNADENIARCLAVHNALEIQLATLAAAKSQNEQVKQLAEKIVQDHAKIQAKLEQLGAPKIDLARATDSNPDRVAARQRDPQERQRAFSRDPNGARTADRDGADQHGGFNFAAIEEQIAQQQLASAQKQWNEKQGAHAEKCFLAGQAVMHQQMIDAEHVLAQHASPKLREAIEESMQVSQAHLKQVEDLLRGMEGQTSPEGARQQPSQN